MSPLPHSSWETSGVFNPAAVQDSGGRVHLLYRAIGDDGISRIGYASSANGLDIDERLSYPVFTMQKPLRDMPEEMRRHDSVMYPSGGSWGGTEDPRIVQIDDTVYMTFNGFDGWDFIRIGIVSIKADDFFAKRWSWSKPRFLSTKGQVHKNWVLFPEKINGKFAILHTIVPTVMIEYIHSIDAMTKEISCPRKGGPQPGRKGHWDSKIRSAGPPPIKTPQGWLVLYHAMDDRDPHIGYKMGAMLLDLQDPTKVIARSIAPILEPDKWYENDWKPGVVYACGAAVKDNILYVYYGGGDKHVCVAHAPIKDLVDWLMRYGKI